MEMCERHSSPTPCMSFSFVNEKGKSEEMKARLMVLCMHLSGQSACMYAGRQCRSACVLVAGPGRVQLWLLPTGQACIRVSNLIVDSILGRPVAGGAVRCADRGILCD
jgi:hypothetical protein